MYTSLYLARRKKSASNMLFIQHRYNQTKFYIYYTLIKQLSVQFNVRDTLFNNSAACRHWEQVSDLLSSISLQQSQLVTCSPLSLPTSYLRPMWPLASSISRHVFRFPFSVLTSYSLFIGLGSTWGVYRLWFCYFFRISLYNTFSRLCFSSAFFKINFL